MGQRESALAAGYARFLWFILVVLLGGEIIAVLVAAGALPLEIFSLMPFSSRGLFVVLAIAAPFLIFYTWLLASRNFEDVVPTDTGIELPFRTFKQMISDERNEIPFVDVENVTFFERRHVEYVEIRLRVVPGSRRNFTLPSLWITDEPAFAAALKDRVAVVQSRPLRQATSRT